MLTFSDVAKQLDPDGKIASIIEILNQRNEILDDAIVQPGNLLTGMRVTVRAGLPAVVFRLANQGVPPSKATTSQLDEQACRIEGWSEIDEMETDIVSDLAQFRLNQAMPFLESMNETMATALFYGNAGINPEQFTGLSVRYSTSVQATAANGANVIKSTGAGSDNMSIWLINWHPQTIFLFYPKNSKAGLEHNDLGLGVIETTAGIAGNRARGYRDQFVWRVGLGVADWRSAVRICNISSAALLGDLSGATVKLVEYMSRAIDRIQGPRGKLAFYTTRTVKSILRVQAMNKSISALGIEPGLNQFGTDRIGGTLTFQGIPVRTVDALLATEATVP